MSITRCQSICADYPFFALSGGDTCYCGDQMPTGYAGEASCATPCVGDNSLTCGGTGFLSVYQSTAGMFVLAFLCPKASSILFGSFRLASYCFSSSLFSFAAVFCGDGETTGIEQCDLGEMTQSAACIGCRILSQGWSCTNPDPTAGLPMDYASNYWVYSPTYLGLDAAVSFSIFRTCYIVDP